VKFAGQLIPGEAVAWICVASLDARQYVQVVPAGDFFIGSGSACHLRLGDASIPELLAGITVDERSARLRCHSWAPVVCLNGKPVEQSFLSDGDLLEVGPYRLVFCLSPAEVQTALPLPAAVASPVESTAEWLVDRLGEQIEIIKESEHTPESGVTELFAAAKSAGETPLSEENRDLPLEEFLGILQTLERNQHALRLQNEVILDKLTRQYDALVDAGLTPDDSVVPLRAHDVVPRRRASA